MADKLITLKEAADTLGITGEEVKELIDKGEITAYQIGGTHLRLKEDQVYALKPKYSKNIPPPPIDYSHKEAPLKSTLLSYVKDFFYFNDFYLIATSLIIFLLYIIFKSIR